MKTCVKIGKVYIAFDNLAEASAFLERSEIFNPDAGYYGKEVRLSPCREEIEIVSLHDSCFRDDAADLAVARSELAELQRQLDELRSGGLTAVAPE